jgi:hypothetical protein
MADKRMDLITNLKGIYNNGHYDPKVAHQAADEELIRYIDDPVVTELYNRLIKNYG